MASITIRNLDDNLKRRLRVRAAEHGWSMEAEVRKISVKPLASPAHRKTSANRSISGLPPSEVLNWNSIRERRCATRLFLSDGDRTIGVWVYGFHALGCPTSVKILGTWGFSVACGWRRPKWQGQENAEKREPSLGQRAVYCRQ